MLIATLFPDLCYAHYEADTADDVARLCVPLVTQGEVIGLMYLASRGPEKMVFDGQLDVVVRTAEQIALALSNVNLREMLRQQSIIDPLTGLFNRRYLDETLRRELSRAKRKDSGLCTIMLDLDHFKWVNDTIGHDAGDAVLKAVAQVVRNNIRESDLGCRFGGEEIILFLPDCDLATAIQRAEMIRTAIAAINLQIPGGSLGTITASFGVAEFLTDGRDPNSLLHAADQALYRAKQAGRNRVITATG